MGPPKVGQESGIGISSPFKIASLEKRMAILMPDKYFILDSLAKNIYRAFNLALICIII
jgi:hypothetical protein